MLTRSIKNCRDSRLFKGYRLLQPLCNLIGNRPQSATFHTANRWVYAWAKHETINKLIELTTKESCARKELNPQQINLTYSAQFG